MSVKEETEKMEKGVVVNEEVTTEVTVEDISKTSKLKRIGKIGLKVAGIGAVGFIGYLIGVKKGRNEENYDEIVEVESIDIEE